MVSNLITEEYWGLDGDYECQHNNIMGDSFAESLYDVGYDVGYENFLDELYYRWFWSELEFINGLEIIE